MSYSPKLSKELWKLVTSLSLFWADYREKVLKLHLYLCKCANIFSSCQDGYTLEILDIYGIVDGLEKINMAGVSLLVPAGDPYFLVCIGILLHRENRQSFFQCVSSASPFNSA